MKFISKDVSTWAFIVIGGIAAIGIYLLNNIHRNVFVNIGAGVWDTYNMATGLMGDILSYIRLYALVWQVVCWAVCSISLPLW